MRDADILRVAVGFFDGVHIGHRAILEGADRAVTFRNHPLSVLSPERAPRLIMDERTRLDAIAACGVRDVVALDFTKDTAHMPPEEFALNHLAGGSVDAVPRTRVLCGANWRFGRGGAGDAGLLRRMGFEVVVVPYAEYKGERVSSSRIRRAIECGAIEDANAMLGRRYSVFGETFAGKGEGASLGYPTVNIDVGEQSLKMPTGVYEVEVSGARGVANYGVAPTFGERAWKRPVLEIHFPCERPEIPSGAGTVCVSFVRFMRHERAFDTLEELKRQISSDCESVVRSLGNLHAALDN